MHSNNSEKSLIDAMKRLDEDMVLSSVCQLIEHGYDKYAIFNLLDAGTLEVGKLFENGEYFIADLIDMAVYDEKDQYLGILTNVIETGANDVYEVKFEDGREVLFPAIKQCILDVDMEGREMKVHIMDGLLD